MMKWVEIADFHEKERLETLSLALREAGLENEVTFKTSNQEELAQALKEAKAEFSQIRIGGDLCNHVLEHFSNIPISPKQIGFADAIVCENGEWWPRNFISEGIHRAVVSDIKNLDVGAAVFILGATCEARAAVAAFSRMGFNKFTLSDPDEARGQHFVESLRSTYFQLQFQFVPRQMITQLPSVHFIAVNTMVKGRDDGAISELVYFNFLMQKGLWVDMALIPMNVELTEEAQAAGVSVEDGPQIASYTDWLWAESCFSRAGVRLDRADYAAKLVRKLTGAGPQEENQNELKT